MAAVQFDHRILAYGLAAFVLMLVGAALRDRSLPGRPKSLVFALGGIVAVQIALGIGLLLGGVPLAPALLHQHWDAGLALSSHDGRASSKQSVLKYDCRCDR